MYRVRSDKQLKEKIETCLGCHFVHSLCQKPGQCGSSSGGWEYGSDESCDAYDPTNQRTHWVYRWVVWPIERADPTYQEVMRMDRTNQDDRSDQLRGRMDPMRRCLVFGGV